MLTKKNESLLPEWYDHNQCSNRIHALELNICLHANSNLPNLFPAYDQPAGPYDLPVLPADLSSGGSLLTIFPFSCALHLFDVPIFLRRRRRRRRRRLLLLLLLLPCCVSWCRGEFDLIYLVL